MFETPKEIKPSASKGLWIGIAVAVIVVGVGAYFFIASRGGKQTPVAATAPAQPKEAADAVRDLKVQRTTMDKSKTGTATEWLVAIENKSQAYTYSDIQYETTYVGADDKALLINKGTIASITLAPGEQKNCQINDVLYPAGTVRYRFRITGATSSVQ
ncbi:MAG TPA: hypothetical protein VMH48_11055 [Methylomirabilota bacterium]|nr:hypothetical protein [Methylomirabilota bacterium]